MKRRGSKKSTGFRAGLVRGFVIALALGAGAAGAESPNAEARRAVRLYESGAYEEAARAFERARELARERGEPIAELDYNLGTAYARGGELDRAIEVLEEAAARPIPDASRDLHENAYYNLGVTRSLRSDAVSEEGPSPEQQREELVKALEAFRQALTLDPSDADARHNYAVTYRRLKAVEEAMRQPEPPPPHSGGDEPSPENQPQGDGGDAQSGDPPGNEGSDQPKAGEGDGPEQDGAENGTGDSPPPSEEGGDAPGPDDESERERPAPGETRQQGGLEAEPTPAPTPGHGASKPPAPQPADPMDEGSGSAAGSGNEDDPQGLTAEQIDALRVLNALERDRPEQFKQVFRFRGEKERKLERDW
jgi:hypothetical protein